LKGFGEGFDKWLSAERQNQKTNNQKIEEAALQE
jgi:hypothetical protein